MTGPSVSVPRRPVVSAAMRYTIHRRRASLSIWRSSRLPCICAICWSSSPRETRIPPIACTSASTTGLKWVRGGDEPSICHSFSSSRNTRSELSCGSITLTSVRGSGRVGVTRYAANWASGSNSTTQAPRICCSSMPIKTPVSVRGPGTPCSSLCQSHVRISLTVTSLAASLLMNGLILRLWMPASATLSVCRTSWCSSTRRFSAPLLAHATNFKTSIARSRLLSATLSVCRSQHALRAAASALCTAMVTRDGRTAHAVACSSAVCL
ncbi:hypothetical protein DL89DRAFT_89504 [Linderina pennispora]|uniref:Uncharacterized protein n=1 Tax=Linderina pennispora TaxID=61395 RepID=A0A1Y1WI26_9FUNG|nr:uncharacterized protein DL89DRAFT_89504 [Linderina pennispora]ORX73179.1 hypothetical protein DL89DRAFT_89504 [Linderina pennispora]